eukprot:scaffold305486_cov29-Prasinocladus_malaysianus.AAC.1
MAGRYASCGTPGIFEHFRSYCRMLSAITLMKFLVHTLATTSAAKICFARAKCDSYHSICRPTNKAHDPCGPCRNSLLELWYRDPTTYLPVEAVSDSKHGHDPKLAEATHAFLEKWCVPHAASLFECILPCTFVCGRMFAQLAEFSMRERLKMAP